MPLGEGALRVVAIAAGQNRVLEGFDSEVVGFESAGLVEYHSL